MGNRTKREEISKLETACASLEKQLREKELEVLCMFKMLGGQIYQVPALTVSSERHTRHQRQKRGSELKLRTCSLRY